jgi:hypothetical protein
METENGIVTEGPQFYFLLVKTRELLTCRAYYAI